MIEIIKEWRILKYINDNGPKTFSELVISKEINLSRNTVNKYIRILREKKWINAKYEDDKKLNYITTDGKIELEKKIGKDDLSHRLNAYYLYEKKIKEYQDSFLERLGELPNSLMLDCIEYFLEFEDYKFSERMPSRDFQFYLAYYLARFNIQYSKSRSWVKMQPPVMQFTQKEFIEEYKLNQTEINYYSQEWGKIRHIFPILDENETTWFLSSNSLLYEILMSAITLRTRRGTLQEIVFDNFIFSVSEEAIYILKEAKDNLLLTLDFAQNQQFLIFIEKIMNIFLEGKMGYKSIWLNLPNDYKSLMVLSVDLETELEQIERDSPRRLEIIRALYEINIKLNNHDEAVLWGEQYLEINPKDLNMPVKMVMEYYYTKKYTKFLALAKKISAENQYDIIARMKLVEYYIEIDQNLTKALEIVEKLEKILFDNPNLLGFYAGAEFYKAKIFFLLDQLDYARIYAEKVWMGYLRHSDKEFSLLFDVYKKMEDWETLEDFCMNAYTENRFSPIIFCNLFYAHLKRESIKKAQHVYEYVEHYYPEYIKELEKIKQELNQS